MSSPAYSPPIPLQGIGLATDDALDRRRVVLEDRAERPILAGPGAFSPAELMEYGAIRAEQATRAARHQPGTYNVVR